MKLKTFAILETTANTKQPLRWKFTQSIKYSQYYPPILIACKKSVALKIYLTKI